MNMLIYYRYNLKCQMMKKKEFQIYMYFSACEQQNTHQFVVHVCVCQQQFKNNKLLI